MYQQGVDRITPDWINTQQLVEILQESIGEVIGSFAKRQYHIGFIRKSITNKLQQLSLSTAQTLQPIQSSPPLSDSSTSLFPPQPSVFSLDVEILTDKISIFIWVLARAPGVWVQLLNQQRLCSQSTQLDLYLFTSKVCKRLVKHGSTLLPQFSHYSTLSMKAIIHYLQFLSNQITYIYNINKKLVVQELDELNTDTKEMKLLNKFMVFKLLKELNHSLRESLTRNLKESVFCYVDPDGIEAFTNYIIDKHDIINFVLGTHHPSTHSPTKQSLPEDQLVEKLLMLGSNMKKMVYRKATREDGKGAILLEIQKDVTDDEEVESYLITVDDEEDQLLVYNPAFTRKKWSIEERANQTSNMQSLIESKNSIIKEMRGAPKDVKVLPKNSLTIGGSLGHCLANLNKYDSLQSFVADFSATAVVSTSLNFLVANVPMIGYVLVTGGFSMTFYKIMKSDFKNGKKKLQDIGSILLGSTTSIGTGFIGGLVGSAFIPIPVLGFFLGGLVGGFVGGITSNALKSALESSKFHSIVQYFRTHIILEGPDTGSWDVNKESLWIIGIQKQYFFESIPSGLQTKVGCDKHWLALIGFCVLTFNETNTALKKKDEQRKDIERGKDVELEELRVSEELEMALGYLQRTRIHLRPNVLGLEGFFRQMFSI